MALGRAGLKRALGVLAAASALAFLPAADPSLSPPDRETVRILPADSTSTLEAKAARVVPSERQVAWQELEFQAFVHFGMNTFTDREWGQGTEDPRLFNPTVFDASQWVETFKTAGMRGVVFSAKHHDGFCLWPSRFTDHTVAQSLWRGGKGDAVRDVADACRQAGLKFGVYLSPWDRHERTYGDSPRYNAFFLNQLRELLTQYGEISEVWFDGACGEGPNGKRQVYDWAAYWALVRELQPRAVISIMGPDVRWIGNEAGVTRESEWSVIPLSQADDRPAEKDPGGIAGINAQAPDLGSTRAVAEVARRGGRLLWYPGQVDVSIRPGWFYHASEDMKVKTLGHLLDIYYTSVGGNAQLLLNVPPDRHGRIHESDVLRLRELGETLRRTFAENVVRGASGAASSVRGPGEGAEAAVDGDSRTAWTAPEGVTRATLEYDLGGGRAFNTAMLQENIRAGQRISSFTFDVLTDGDWKEVARGTTVGYKRLLRFPTVAASRVRVRILSSRLSPTLAEFGLFLDPARAVPRPTVVPLPEETPGLDAPVLSLNGTWAFAPEPPPEFWRDEGAASDWKTIEVPGEWTTQGFNLGPDVERVYKRQVAVPAEFAGRRLVLRFDGVYSYARVWVDGRYVRDHHGGFTSWDCDVTDFLKPGQKSRLIVGVTDMSDEISWGSSYAKHSLGGILQDVKLIALPPVHAERFHVATDLDERYQNGTLGVTVRLRLPPRETAEVRLTLSDLENRTVRLNPDVLRFAPTAAETTVRIPVGPVTTWDAEHPRLYTLEARVLAGGSTVEVLTKKVGFRKVEVHGNKLFVNGLEVKLRGGNRHHIHPLRGRSVPAEFDLLDARLFRDANINFIRTSHYPPTEAFLEACDRFGLYVEEENAVCFVATHGNLPTSDDPAFRSRYFGQFAEMVERDLSHPSIILWSLGNESRWGANIKPLYDHVKSEDPSRPVIWSYPDTVPKGQPGYDVYSAHYPPFDADLRSPAVPRLNDEWAHVACYNVNTLRRDPGVRDAWGESLRKFWENAATAGGSLGGAIWGLIDDVTFLPSNGAGYGEWGIVDGWRRLKPEYWHVKKAYSPVRVDDRPVANPGPGQPLRIPVRNWFDHTNLDELAVGWSVGGRSGWVSGLSVPPHGEGVIVIQEGDWKAGDVVHLRFLRARSLVVDEYALPVGPPAAAEPPPAPEGPPPQIIETERILTVRGANFRLVFDKTSGLLETGELGGTRLIAGGPFLACAPATLLPWTLNGFERRIEGHEAVLDMRGSFAGALARFIVRVDGRGLITVDYVYEGRPEGASEMGVAFVLPAEVQSLSWERRGLHSVYPPDHIGRNGGVALKVRPGTPDVYRTKPAWTWAEDMTDWFLFGRNHLGNGATRDFRSLKANVRWAAVDLKGTPARVVVEGDGSEAVRAEVLPDGSVLLNILDQWAYPDLDWGNYEGRTDFPATSKGTVRVRLTRASEGPAAGGVEPASDR